MDKGFQQLLERMAEKIKAKREAAGLSQEALALEASVDRTYVSQLERGVANPSLKTLYRLCAVLKTDLKTLLH